MFETQSVQYYIAYNLHTMTFKMPFFVLAKINLTYCSANAVMPNRLL